MLGILRLKLCQLLPAPTHFQEPKVSAVPHWYTTDGNMFGTLKVSAILYTTDGNMFGTPRMLAILYTTEGRTPKVLAILYTTEGRTPKVLATTHTFVGRQYTYMPIVR